MYGICTYLCMEYVDVLSLYFLFGGNEQLFVATFSWQATFQGAQNCISYVYTT